MKYAFLKIPIEKNEISKIISLQLVKLIFIFGIIYLPISLNAQTDTLNVFTTDTFSTCQADSIIINSLNYNITTPTFSWSNGAVDSTITVFNSGNYSVTITNSTDTIIDSIMVFNDTIIDINLSNSLVCFNTAIVELTNYHPLGIWSGNHMQNDSFDIVSAGGIGNYSVYYNIINGTCIDSNVVVLEVRTIPNISVSNDTLIYCNLDINNNIDSALYFPHSGFWFGDGIIGQAIFNPRFTAGLSIDGSDSLHYAIYQVQDTLGCTNQDTLNILLTYGDTLILQDELGICRNNGLDTLSKYAQISNTNGIVWSGNGIINSSLGIFDPQLPNVDTINPNIIIVTQGEGACAKKDSLIIYVGISPTITAGLDKNICLNAGLDTLVGFQPIDYTNAYWSGNGIIDSLLGVFNPQIIGVGLHTLQYNWVNPITNCSTFDEITINVLSPPITSVTPTIDTICNQTNILLSDYFTISPNNLGNEWIGNGITASSQGVFSPIDTGNYVLSYVYIDSNFCSDTSEVIVHITNGALVDAGNDLTICLNSGQQTLQAFPQGGLWNSKLQGLVTSTQAIYEPLFVGGGVTDTLIYTYNDSICINKDTILLTINNFPVVSMNYNDTVCINADSYLLGGNYPLSGGSWTGSNGVINPSTGLYNPSQILERNDTLTYFYTDNTTGCTNFVEKIITIDTIPFVSMTNINPFYFRDEISVPLNGIPTDGIFYSNSLGVSFVNNNYTFIPQSTNTNNLNIYFTYTDGNGCTDADTQNITIADRFANVSTNNIIALGNNAIDWGDYDNDGDLDFIMIGSNISGRQTLIYNNNNGNFILNTALSNNFLQIDNGDVKWGDYDNDGDLDVAISGSVANSIFPTTKIYENRINQTGNFVEDIQVSSILVGVNNSRVEWEDMDNDGDLDLIVLGQTALNSGLTRIYENRKNTSGTFSVLATLEPINSGAISIGDYDNDMDNDIVITGFSTLSNTPQTILYQNINGQFFSNFTALTDLQESEIKFGDYDNDGDLDIILNGVFVQSNSRTTRIFENSNGNFSNVTTGFNALEGLEKSSIDWGDYDNDGDLDFLVIGKRNISDAGYSKIYRNNLGDSLLPAFNTLPINFTNLYGGKVNWVDYDNDGDLDISLIGSQISTNNNYFKLYQNRNELNSNTNNLPPTAPSNLQDSVILATGDVTFSFAHSFDNSTPYNTLSYNLLIGNTINDVDNISPMSNVSTGKRNIIKRGNLGLNNITIIKNLSEGKHYWRVQAIDNNFDGSPFSVIDSFDVRRIQVDSVAEIICAGATVDIFYSTIATNYFNTNNTFTVELSTVSDDFANPISIGTINVDTSGSISVTIPENTVGGMYKVRIIADYPNSVSLPYENDILINPTSGFVISTADSMFCNGNSTVLTIPNTTNYTYQWKMNNTLLFGVTDTFLQVMDTAIFSVLITTEDGCMDSASIHTIYYADPSPNFNILENCLLVSFEPENTSTISQGSIIDYQWFFGDGNIASSFEPTHQYAQVDTFDIKLITTSINTCKDSITKPIVIHPLPKASFEFDDVCFGEDVVLTNNSELPVYGTIDTFVWDFGDTTFSLLENPIHSYNKSDTFYINLKAISDKACVTDTTRKLTIHPLPRPNFEVADICQYERADFNNLSEVILVPIDSFIWTFDDGYFSTDSLPSHIYNIADTFSVNLLTISPFGCEKDTSLPLIIHPVPETGFYALGACNEDYAIQFYDTSSIQSGIIANFQWYFGDGNQSNNSNPLHQYNSETTYDVTFVTTSDQGCLDTMIQSTPSSLLPIADFEFYKNPISLGDTLRPQNYSINATEYLWDFGDFNVNTNTDTSILETPKYFYTDYGLYTVSLLVRNELECTDTISRIVKVQPRPRSDYEPFIYPNPTQGQCILNIDLKKDGELEVFVYNALGQIVWQTKENATIPLDPFDLYKVEINLENVLAGIYFVKIFIDGLPYSTTETIQNGPLKDRDLDYNSLKILVIKP